VRARRPRRGQGAAPQGRLRTPIAMHPRARRAPSRPTPRRRPAQRERGVRARRPRPANPALPTPSKRRARGPRAATKKSAEDCPPPKRKARGKGSKAPRPTRYGAPGRRPKGANPRKPRGKATASRPRPTRHVPLVRGPAVLHVVDASQLGGDVDAQQPQPPQREEQRQRDAPRDGRHQRGGWLRGKGWEREGGAEDTWGAAGGGRGGEEREAGRRELGMRKRSGLVGPVAPRHSGRIASAAAPGRPTFPAAPLPLASAARPLCFAATALHDPTPDTGAQKHTQSHTHARTHARTHTHAHTHTHTRNHTRIHNHTRTHNHTRIHTHNHKLTQSHTHTHTITITHTHIHTFTQPHPAPACRAAATPGWCRTRRRTACPPERTRARALRQRPAAWCPAARA
jgi:hypothetical protein